MLLSEYFMKQLNQLHSHMLLSNVISWFNDIWMDSITFKMAISWLDRNFLHNLTPVFSKVTVREYKWTFFLLLCSIRDRLKICMNFSNWLYFQMNIIIVIETILFDNYLIVSNTTLKGTLYFVEKGKDYWMTKLTNKYD